MSPSGPVHNVCLACAGAHDKTRLRPAGFWTNINGTASAGADHVFQSSGALSMKPAAIFSALCFAVLVCSAQAAVPTQPPTQLTGLVLETRSADSYTYLRLKTASGEVWAAGTYSRGSEAPVGAAAGRGWPRAGTTGWLPGRRDGNGRDRQQAGRCGLVDPGEHRLVHEVPQVTPLAAAGLVDTEAMRDELVAAP